MKKSASVKVKKEENPVENPKNRYSDAELEEFREIILKKLEKQNFDRHSPYIPRHVAT